MWKDVGIIRSGPGLEHALKELAALDVQRPEEPNRAGCERYNVWALGQLIARSALAREESRGSHYRSDFPFRNDEDFLKHSVISLKSKVTFH
jgi:L-aspartate oxidase